MSGIFLPLSQYHHDLARSMNGLTHLYPSKFVTLTTTKSIKEIRDAVDTASDFINQLLTDTQHIPYSAIRNSAWGMVYQLASIKDSTTEEGAPAYGDINFLSHEVMGGMMYSDIYVHVSPELGQYTSPLQPSAGENPVVSGFALDPETGLMLKENSSRTELTFNLIILYYNLYQIDPSTKTAEYHPICLDMPLGIYIPDSPVRVKIESPELFGQGTSWSTRICSRFTTSQTISAVPDGTKTLEYATLTKILSEFGDINSTMNEILHSRGATDNNETGLSQADIKSYLEEFRAQKQVNVPYIKDNYWFVNGRKMEPVINENELRESLIRNSQEILSSLTPEEQKKFRGPEGPIGPVGPAPQISIDSTTKHWIINGDETDWPSQGETGSNGKTPRIVDGYWAIPDDNDIPVSTGVLAQGPKGEQGEQGKEGKQGDPGPAPKITPDGYWAVYENGNYVSTRVLAQGPKGDKGDDGKKGDTPVVTINPEEPYNWIVDGTNTNMPAIPFIGENGNWYVAGMNTGLKAKGDDGEPGGNGFSPYINSLGYWVTIDGVTDVQAQGPKGDKGDNGNNGMNGTNGLNGTGIFKTTRTIDQETDTITTSETDAFRNLMVGDLIMEGSELRRIYRVSGSIVDSYTITYTGFYMKGKEGFSLFRTNQPGITLDPNEDYSISEWFTKEVLRDRTLQVGDFFLNDGPEDENSTPRNLYQVTQIDGDNFQAILICDLKGPKGDKGDKGDPGSGSDIEVDDELDDNSENPVQNKVITQALETLWNETYPYSYGVYHMDSVADPKCIRVGNMDLHKTLPIQSKMRGCLLDDDGTVLSYLDENDWTDETRDGSGGQVMVEIPEHYRKFIYEDGKLGVWLSEKALDGYHKVPKMYISAYEAALDRNNLKLSSVVNTTEQYRGGNNTSDWDDTYRSLLGMPATNINLTNFRKYARNRSVDVFDTNEQIAQWNCYTYEAHVALYWLFVVEYATLNSQAEFNPAKDANGYRQGGLGPGVSTLNSSAWNSYNGYNPFIPCGYTDSLGNNTGVVEFNMQEEYGSELIIQVPRYRGIENPFGHIWKWMDGILVYSAGAGIIENPVDFGSNTAAYSKAGRYIKTKNILNKYITKIYCGEYGDLIPADYGTGSSSTYFCDYAFWYATTTDVDGVYVGGHASLGQSCGFCYLLDHIPTNIATRLGGRLCFHPLN